VELKESKTQAPGYLTESDLITLMEKNQIGTDSTIHEHIETIQARKYAVKANNTFKPTNLGASLIVTYKNLGLKLEDCHIRRMMEQRMNHIADGTLDINKATVDTLEEVTPIYRQLKAITKEWLDQMKAAM
jgi:DNA topoisomerase-3